MIKEPREPTKAEQKAWWLYKTKALIVANVEKIKNQNTLNEILFLVEKHTQKTGGKQ